MDKFWVRVTCLSGKSYTDFWFGTDHDILKKMKSHFVSGLHHRIETGPVPTESNNFLVEERTYYWDGVEMAVS